MKKLYVLLFLFSLTLGTNAIAQTIRYVKAGGTGDGSTWANAAGDLQAMINLSAANDEVWVAAGTHKPTRRADVTGTVTLNDRYNSFVLKKDVAIYGGFAGTETNRLNRNFTANLTVLSGNIGDQATDLDNAYHVVVASGDLGTARLDGFTVTKGYTNGTGTGSSVSVNGNSIPPTRSPGIINYYSSATYENLIITDNVNGSTDQSAGAIYILYGSPIYNKVKFINNKTTSTSGGAVFIFSAVATPSKPIFNEVDFSGNEGSSGGAIVLSTAAAPTFNKCTFTGNKATTTGGALHMFSASASATFTDCTFSGNEAITNGGAINNGLGTTITINRSTFTNNTAATGGAIYFTTGTLNIAESTFTSNKAGSTGAVYLGTSTLQSSLSDLSFIGNEATAQCGALYLSTNSPIMRNLKFIGNKAATNGGAIFMFASTGGTVNSNLINNLFYNNEAASSTGGGGAIYASSNVAVTLHNATFFSNKAVNDGGAVYSSASAVVTIYNSILNKNQSGKPGTAELYSAAAGGASLVVRASLTDSYGVNGANDNIVGQDPVFESKDPNNPEFLFLQDFSPAIDAGQANLLPAGVAFDLANNNRINNSILDMGAFEFGGAAPVPPLQISINENTADGTFVVKPITTLPGPHTNWTILSGNSTDAFEINPTSGNITVANSEQLDYEKVETFTLTVKVFNSLGNDQVMRVIVKLNNLMEDPGTPIIANLLNGVLTSFKPKLSGTAEPLSTISVYVDDVLQPVTTFSNAEGNWTFNFAEDLTPGFHTFHVVANNNLGTSNPSDKASATLKLFTGVITPNNILTPNGDGKNDLWLVENLTVMYPKNEVMVYDKTGRIVFKQSNYQSDWDGTSNGAVLNTGTYYYHIIIGADLKPIKGTITILRGR